MEKWIVTRTETWEVEAETGPEAKDLAQQSQEPGEVEFSAETEDGEQPCEGCGKPATCADSEGVPLCKTCFDAETEESLADLSMISGAILVDAVHEQWLSAGTE
jgi:hypothetical protein